MMRIIGFIAYWALAITQFLGVYTYFGDVLDWNGFVAVIIALLLGGIPIVGTILGVMGATQGWGWELVPALCLYLWPFIVFVMLVIVSNLTNRDRY